VRGNVILQRSMLNGENIDTYYAAFGSAAVAERKPIVVIRRQIHTIVRILL
jgi:hypothetical protein